ncbi:MOSC domain-containing protein [Nocardioides bizhenqiangii]|uniref:MOSC domain-containing protein n=1 Tax=Nocardioides bizhenqiangii TaxID=3095076 RepID=A0ABZ0ZSL0_9ACTN|nr:MULTISPECIES: MOSC domain-containing protein [unclassified Nocardioides]MDZ5622013.1 MOSC domain-containing protein [Nocardioides sp. HM23]WQQ27310.1 MOSC domain-containing protein [Nocardioides sp. HM61]
MTELWRYPVKSMGGEQVGSSVVDQRALHADRMWAVRDLELGAVTTARRLPTLLGCTARFVDEPPAGVGPGDVAHVVVTFPDGTEVTSTDPETMDARLSELTGTKVALVPLPPLDDKAGYRGVLATKKDIRKQFGVPDDEPLPDFSMFPLSKLATLAIYATPVGIFADAYPLHIVTTSSLRTMAALGGDFDVRRFRPNIVVDSDLEGLAEQEWLGGVLRAGEVTMRVEIPTIRCTMPLREQAGVPADPQVMKTVSRHGDRCFGVYADVASGGTLRVGDAVDFEAPASPGAIAGSLGRLAERVKRNTVKASNKMMPR